MSNAHEVIAIASERYEQLVKESKDYKLIFDEYLWDFVERRQAITSFRLFKITDAERTNNFEACLKQNVFQFPTMIIRAFHGPSFQEDQCSFDFETNMCTGHSDTMMVFTDNPLYTFCNQGRRTQDTSVGYLMLCNLIVSKQVIRDPEILQPLADYFVQGYDTILDYGNRRWIKKMSNEILPLCLIEYGRKYNSRLDNPLNQIFEAEGIQPSPEVSFERLNPNSDEFAQCQSGLPTDINILSITKIINPYLEQKYLEFQAKYSPNAQEMTLFHGTTFECARLIAQFNLDWRKCSHGRHGWGVHFAKYLKYAKFFPENNYDRPKYFEGPKKCIIMFTTVFDPTKLYSVNKGEQLNGMEFPPEGYDSVHILKKNRFSQFVKFNDNEFLPKYIIIINNI